MTNRLKDEKSPYLLQHQHNPVDWYSWNPATLAHALSTGKPIFLSSGYSTCHWCHVMERESFENPAIAAIMNEHFINIKLDREEHPDIDRIYMTFIQAISGSGGWPMSVFMTPSLKPFYGGTYFPPEDRYYGRPGFKALLLSIAEQWEENKQSCITSSEKIVEVLRKTATLPVGTSLPSESGKKCLNQLARSYEPAYGGFSEQPKFPQPVNLQFLIQFSRKEKDCFKMVEKTLKMMRKGGIYDHLGQGFCRYSTDKKWHVPHFEKMLYDQSQLVSAYLNAFLVSKDSFYSDVAREVLDYVARDMSVEDGGFYSAEDADSLPTKESDHKKEGAFYVWEKHEIDDILKDLKLPDGKGVNELFNARYGVKQDGNVDPYQDPHDELKKKNVIFEAKDYETLSKEFNIEVTAVKDHLDEAKQVLFNWRNTNRPRPHLDNKFIASWNGLMTSAYAQAGFALGEQSYIDRAVKAAEFIENNFYFEGKFLRTCYVTDSGLVTNLDSPIFACVDDYCNVIGAMIDLFQATGNVKYLNTAVDMQAKQDELFWDDQNGGYFNSVSDPSVLVRMKDDDDGAEPSSNSTGLINLLRLNTLFPDSPMYGDKVTKLLYQFSDRIEKLPITLPLMTSGLLSFQTGVTSVFVVGPNVRSHELFIHLRNQLIPAGGIIVAVDTSQDIQALKTLLPILNEKTKITSTDDVVAYVRRGGVEEKVVRKVEDLQI